MSDNLVVIREIEPKDGYRQWEVKDIKVIKHGVQQIELISTNDASKKKLGVL